MDTHTQQIAKQVVDDLRRYKVDSDATSGIVAAKIGCTQSNLDRWLKGDGLPSSLNIQRCIDAGLTSVRLPEVVQHRALTTILENVDTDNKVPRVYKKRVSVPPIISNQVKLLIDDYMIELEQPATWKEFTQSRDELIRKVYYICRQG